MQCDSIPPSSPLAKPLVYGSVCSGIEAATAAWHPLGWQPAFFSEIDNFPRAVLTHHYPDTPLHGDFTTIGKDDYDPIDLLVGGTPCQSFSVAGLRKGFADERGNLTLEFVRLAERLGPRWLVWENVPGVLSQDRGRAFGSFLWTLAELGYGFAYRVLDAQYFGLAQRRQRVFVVAHLGDWRPAAAVLFEREGLLGDTTPSREAGKSVAATLTGGTDTGRNHGKRSGSDRDTLIVSPLCARSQSRGVDSDCTATLVTHALRAEGFDASEDGTGRGTPIIPINMQAAAKNGSKSPNGTGIGEPGDPAPTLGANDQHAVACPAGVRRLTPRECERLQGFPDDYTLVPYRGKPAADGPRYKSLGNSMAVPCMSWIGRRISELEEVVAVDSAT